MKVSHGRGTTDKNVNPGSPKTN